MFISRTTREEHVTIETALDSAFLKIDQAEQLIYDLILLRLVTGSILYLNSICATPSPHFMRNF